MLSLLLSSGWIVSGVGGGGVLNSSGKWTFVCFKGGRTKCQGRSGKNVGEGEKPDTVEGELTKREGGGGHDGGWPLDHGVIF